MPCVALQDPLLLKSILGGVALPRVPLQATEQELHEPETLLEALGHALRSSRFCSEVRSTDWSSFVPGLRIFPRLLGTSRGFPEESKNLGAGRDCESRPFCRSKLSSTTPAAGTSHAARRWHAALRPARLFIALLVVQSFRHALKSRLLRMASCCAASSRALAYLGGRLPGTCEAVSIASSRSSDALLAQPSKVLHLTGEVSFFVVAKAQIARCASRTPSPGLTSQQTSRRHPAAASEYLPALSRCERALRLSHLLLM